ncbi:MAG: class I SAM-dependent methyltransferase [Beijerinckiaceae bacterium]|nr:class I SAM-dependent methyltransferase [Beijerinckiaceae bacterium]
MLCCRSCGAALSTVFVDLGVQPISNRFRSAADQSKPETFYPLRAFACDACKLVQLQDFGTPDEHFNDDYVYFSSFSTSWLEHARLYAGSMIERLKLDETSFVVEIASNDGYLLQNFVKAGIPCLGVDPAANCAAAARRQFGVETHVGFFGVDTAQALVGQGRQADLMAANNVLAHVPDINDFVAGFKILLKPAGVATFEFPHLLELMRHTQFDTIYHEHYSYLSLTALEPLFARHGLEMFDVERLSTHGGSLRLHVGHAGRRRASPAVDALRRDEAKAGLGRIETYASFGAEVVALKRRFLALLGAIKDAGKTIAGYGAPAKGNTLLNFCGVRTDFVDFTVDRNPAKQGLFLPGVAIPVLDVAAIRRARPDYVLILPWNLRDEIVADLSFIADWGGRFIVAIPEPHIVETC